MIRTSNQNQKAERRCVICQRLIPSGAPEGLCMHCLFDAGLAISDGSPPGVATAPGGETAGPAPRYFGDYELLREAGCGGMGIVYEARQFGTQRIVALKLLSAGALATRDAVNRFQTEAQAAARLEHPHIVPIYETGVHNGQYFLTMRYLTGGTLAQSLAESPVAPRRAAEIVRTVAEAVHYAHQHGVLHRDLKPGNILLDAAGEPHVADFGLARLAERDTGVTLPSSVLGTVNYMPPEQAREGAAAVTTAADVYGLGAVLYELLAGRPPFAGTDFFDTLRRVIAQEPIPPSLVRDRVSLAPSPQLGSQASEGSSEQSDGRSSSGSLDRRQSIPADLETICLKCLEKEPAKRYATAQELADDLERYLADEPIHATPVGPGGRFWRWCRRKPVTAILVAALNVALVLGVTGVLWEWQRAVASELTARERQYVSDVNLAQQAWEAGNLKQAHDLLRAHLPTPRQLDLRGFEWRYLWNLCQAQNRSAFTNFDAPVTSIVYSPGGAFLAVGAGSSIKLLDRLATKELGVLIDGNTNESLACLVFQPGTTNIVAAAGKLGVIKLWNLTTREFVKLGEHPSGVGSIAFSPDGKMLAVASSSGAITAEAVSGATLSLWDAETKMVVWTTNLARCAPNAVGFTPDGKALVSGGGGGNGNARVWEAASGKELTPSPNCTRAGYIILPFLPTAGPWPRPGLTANSCFGTSLNVSPRVRPRILATGP